MATLLILPKGKSFSGKVPLQSPRLPSAGGGDYPFLCTCDSACTRDTPGLTTKRSNASKKMILAALGHPDYATLILPFHSNFTNIGPISRVVRVIDRL